MKRYLLLPLLIAALQYRAFAQEIHFTTVDPPKEQPKLVIAGIAQDAAGYLWLTTFNGLYKYDGKEFTHYQHDDNDPNSVAGVALGAICADKDGIMWISPFGVGLDRFDPVTNTFTHYRHHANDPGSLACDSVASLLVDREGTLWVGTFRGL